MDKGFRLTLNGLSATGIPWRLLGEKLLGLICEFTQGVLSNEKLQNYTHFDSRTKRVWLSCWQNLLTLQQVYKILDSVAAVDELRVLNSCESDTYHCLPLCLLWLPSGCASTPAIDPNCGVGVRVAPAVTCIYTATRGGWRLPMVPDADVYCVCVVVIVNAA